MGRNPRFHDTGAGSFFGSWLLKGVVDDEHPLVAIKWLLDWEALTQDLIRLYKGRGVVGRRPYPPVLIFKMLFLSFLYGLSERDVERAANDSLAMKYFLDLAVDTRAPDHSSLTVFKNRIIAQGDCLEFASLEKQFHGAEDVVTNAAQKGRHERRVAGHIDEEILHTPHECGPFPQISHPQNTVLATVLLRPLL